MTFAGILVGFGVIGFGTWGALSNGTSLPSAGAPPPVPLSAPNAAVRQSTPVRPAEATTTTASTTTTVPILPTGATQVDIPSLAVNAEATAVAITAGNALAVPDNPATVGWWMPLPSVLVIDGHVDAALTGPGALFELRTLKPGASILIDTPLGGTERWELDGLRTYTKGQLPDTLFSQPGPRLVIITCGGPFDYATHHYYDNVVAYASPA